jgi:putative membrane protein insertion efficiency factor
VPPGAFVVGGADPVTPLPEARPGRAGRRPIPGALSPRRVVGALLRLYQRVVSPLYPPSCRFYPSCSQYALVAVERHGVLRGSRLAVWRLLRCNPWNAGGVDDVPSARVKDEARTSHDHHQH